MKRVVVVGAGPAGSAAAMALACEPRVECILVEKRTLPRTKVCGSGLSPWTLNFLDSLGVGPLIRKEAYRINGALIAGIEGPGVELRGHHETAILLRERFDQLLAEEAVRRGATLREGIKVQEIVRDKESAIGVRTTDGSIEADIVVNCSGAVGGLTRHRAPGATLHTIMGWYEGVDRVSDVVELYFDRGVKPHYGWVFPESQTRVNIGICFVAREGAPAARERFEAFLDARLGKRLTRSHRLGKLVGHPVHVSSFPRGIIQQGVLHAGEAGRLADYSTAEGIYHALVSGWLAGNFLKSCTRTHGRVTSRDLAPYAKLVRRTLGMRMVCGRLLGEALRTPALDAALGFGSSRYVRAALRRSFAGLYHG